MPEMPRVALLTREYPPDVYGGAGVHVEYLARELDRLVELTVHCFGADRPAVGGPHVVAHTPWERLSGRAPYAAALEALSVDLAMAAAVEGADLVHSHTWYANLAGHLAKLVHGIPHVATVHSLEPLRPWKAEQLGGGYAVSSWCERTALEAADAVIAVSAEHRRDLLACYPLVDPELVSVIGNGIDTDEYRPDPATDLVERDGVDPGRPYVLFVGRVTRQKGLTHLLDAADRIDPAAQLVLCAGAADTPELATEIHAKLERVRGERDGVVWIERMLPRRELIQLLTHASVFVCPSIYEPLGIVNLEAMACATPVVATATGGIPEVVLDGVTGLLVPFDPVDDPSRRPRDPDRFAQDLAVRIDRLLDDPAEAARLGAAGRERAMAEFSWTKVAERVRALYSSLLSVGRRSLQDDRGDDHRPADQRHVRRPFRPREPDPERAEHDLEQGDQRHLGRGQEPGAHRQEREPEPDLRAAEQDEQDEVVQAHTAGMGERAGGGEHEQLREADRGRHRDVAPMARDHDADREGEGHQHREQEADAVRAARATDHHGHSGERHGHRRRRSRRRSLVQREPGDRRGGDRRGRLQEEDVRDGRVVERDDERPGGGRRAPGDRQLGASHRGERAHPAVRGEEDEREQRDEREDGAAGDLGRGPDRELALKHARGRPGERRCDGVGLAATTDAGISDGCGGLHADSQSYGANRCQTFASRHDVACRSSVWPPKSIRSSSRRFARTQTPRRSSGGLQNDRRQSPAEG